MKKVLLSSLLALTLIIITVTPIAAASSPFLTGGGQFSDGANFRLLVKHLPDDDPFPLPPKPDPFEPVPVSGFFYYDNRAGEKVDGTLTFMQSLMNPMGQIRTFYSGTCFINGEPGGDLNILVIYWISSDEYSIDFDAGGLVSATDLTVTRGIIRAR